MAYTPAERLVAVEVRLEGLEEKVDGMNEKLDDVLAAVRRPEPPPAPSGIMTRQNALFASAGTAVGAAIVEIARAIVTGLGK